MRILLDRDGTVDGLASMLAQLDADPDVGSILVLAGDGNGFRPQTVDAVLTRTRRPLFGGVFPQVLHGTERLERGTVAVGLPCTVRSAVIRGLSSDRPDVDTQLRQAFDGVAAPAGTMFVFVDGFAARISALIDGLYNQFGLDLDYLGGGGGSLSLVPGPCVIANVGLVQDAAVLALADVASGIGVAHGWMPISEPFKVTGVSGNVIETLDWRPAFDVYREVVEAHSGRRFDGDDFFSIAKSYPFGIARLGAEVVVRDPLMRRGDALVCVGEVPPGCFVRILNGDTASLLAAATQARGLAEEAMGDRPSRATLFVDCISRVLYLGDDIAHELAAVAGSGRPVFGVMSIGEIANNGQESLEFYNKTAVVGLL